MTSIVAVDQFCGGGGTSTGLAIACRERSFEPKLYALNHWPIALATHAKNHPWAHHFSEEMKDLDPLKVVTEGRLDLLVSSPECTFFSIARGGKPTEEQLRSSPYEVVRWMAALHPEAVLVENVPEFRAWGPLDGDGFPIGQKRGITFKIWLGRMRGLGYSVDHRVLNAADYGAATSRSRLFVIARRGDQPVHWPVPTHARRDRPQLGLATWRGAREVIDPTLVGESIWERKRPLAFATWRRILIGLERHGGPEVQPFVQVLKQRTHVADAPAKGDPKFVASLGPDGRVTPLVIRTNFECEKTQGRMGAAPRPDSEPMPSVLASSQGLALAEGFIVPVAGRRAQEGIPIKGVSDPFPTVTSRVGWWLTNAVIVPRHGEKKGQRIRAHSVENPMPAVPASDGGILASGVVLRYYSSGGQWSGLDDPVPSVTTKDRLMLVRPIVIDGKFLDIRIRLFREHELAAAQGFPKSYEFVGNRGQVKRQIGNAVEVNVAKALCRTLLAPSKLRGLDGYAG